MSAIVVADIEVGTAELCQSLGVSRASLYRSRQPETIQGEPKPTRAKHPRALDPMERQAVLDTLHSERFCDQSPAEVHATLLEEQTYLCAPRTMYRLLEQAHEVRERRDQLRHPRYTRPELVATGANQVWSWDITKLKGPIKWAYFHLYVILDIFSREVVGWMVARNESARLAERLIEETCAKEDIPPGQLTIHADRGAAMTSKAVALLFSDLGIEASHSRPHVSDDNPFSESHFRTIKYRPGFPERFGSLEQAREVCRALFTWYNTEHHHSSLAFLTPAAVHHGRADEVLEARHYTRLAAYAAHPERFVNGPPRREKLATSVWINPPAKTTLQDAPGSIQTAEVDLRVDPPCITYEPHAGTSPVGLTPINSVEPLQ
jgi:putative transposase